ncbi:MAG: CoA pyrophosphatase [Pseudomonadota bacterium]
MHDREISRVDIWGRTAFERALQAQGRPTSDYDLNAPLDLPANRRLKPAAVLVLLDDLEADGPHLVLTQRASHLKHHPGQIAFAGGKLDAGDADAIAAALREAQEEIGLPPDHVSVIGQLEAHETVTGYQITPVLARLERRFDAVPEAGEVAEVFRVPLAFLLDAQNYRVEGRRWRGAWRKFYAVPWGPYYIWGATARILKALSDRVAE